MGSDDHNDKRPDVTEDDLHAFLGGKNKCRSPEVAAYIEQQRKIAGSPIRKWYDDLERRLASGPKDVDWGKLAFERGEPHDEREEEEGFGDQR